MTNTTAAATLSNLHLTNRGRGVHSAFVTLTSELTGKPYTSAVRAIRERTGGWRIDRAGFVGAWLPWEGIDDHTYPTLRAAREAIRVWVARKGGKPDRRR